MDEIWKAVPSLDGIIASNLGRVARVGGTARSGDGALQIMVDGQYHLVSHLVLEAFKGPDESDAALQNSGRVYHLDGDVKNTNPDNLMWKNDMIRDLFQQVSALSLRRSIGDGG